MEGFCDWCRSARFDIGTRITAARHRNLSERGKHSRNFLGFACDADFVNVVQILHLRRWLLLACFICSFFFAFPLIRWHRGTSPRHIQDWTQLSRDSSASLRDKKFDDIRKQEHLVFENNPAAKSAIDYAQFALNCAKSRRLGKDGDTYRLLRAAEETLVRAKMRRVDTALILDLAEEFSFIHCYRRAFRLIERIPPTQKGDEVVAFERRLLRVFSILRTTLPATERQSTTPEDPVIDQLEDLLGAMPAVGENDEFSIRSDELSLADLASNDEQTLAAKLIEKNTSESPSGMQFALAAFDSKGAKDVYSGDSDSIATG